jgi:two-component system chemotaxis response regulator CheB
VYALVVDDSKPVRSILTKVLEGLQFQCHEAANGVEALDQLVRMPRPTLVTLNRHMPEMDGFELLGRLRRSSQFRDLTVVMISTDCDEASITAAKTLGANDFVGKPFTPSELITRLRSLGVVSELSQLPHRPRSDADVSSIASPGTISPTQPATAASPIRLLLVDDSATIRGILSKTLNAQPGLKVAGTASNGKKALAFLAEETVDVVLLDIEMPVMDGLETLQHLRLLYPRLPVVMFSSLTERGAKTTLEALVAGANDYVPKPTGSDTDAIVSRIESDLVPKLRAVHRPPAPTKKTPAKPAAQPKPFPPASEAPQKKSTEKTEVIVVAVSTGGPGALAEVLPRFVGPATPPVLIVQHMPKEFTKHLSDRLTKFCNHPVTEAVDGQPLKRGDVILAPGGIHIEIVKDRAGCHLAYNHGPPENSCRPSADVLFRSAASIFGKNTLALVLTGMGSDGFLGSQAITATGGTVIAQDEPSSIVWGMPGQVVRAGLADSVLPLDRIGSDIAMRLRRQRDNGSPPSSL